jgi:HEAT repeat protein
VGDPALGVAAVRSLRAGGPAVVPALNLALHDPATPPRAAVRLAFTLGEIGGSEAVAALLGHLDHPLANVRREVLSSLRKCRYRAGEEGLAAVEARLDAEVRDAAWIAGALVDVGEDPRDGTLRQALLCELDRARDRVVSLLSFVYRPQPLLWMRRYLRGGSSEKRAYALEVLGTLTSGRVRALVFPLFEGRSPAETHAELASDRLVGREARIRCLLRAEHAAVTSWLRVAAAALGGENALAAEVRACEGDPSPLVRETALFASGRLTPASPSALPG